MPEKCSFSDPLGSFGPELTPRNIFSIRVSSLLSHVEKSGRVDLILMDEFSVGQEVFCNEMAVLLCFTRRHSFSRRLFATMPKTALQL
jgi:hypothetical protein